MSSIGVSPGKLEAWLAPEGGCTAVQHHGVQIKGVSSVLSNTTLASAVGEFKIMNLADALLNSLGLVLSQGLSVTVVLARCEGPGKASQASSDAGWRDTEEDAGGQRRGGGKSVDHAG